MRRRARRNSPDSDLRALERKAAAGAPTDVAAYLRSLARTRELHPWEAAQLRQATGEPVDPWELLPQGYTFLEAYRMSVVSRHSRSRSPVGRVEAKRGSGPGEKFFVLEHSYPFHMGGRNGLWRDYERLRRVGGPLTVQQILEIHLREVALARAARMIVLDHGEAGAEHMRYSVLGRAPLYSQWRSDHVQSLVPADYTSVRIMTRAPGPSGRWKNNPPERDLRLAREELDDAIFFKKPQKVIKELQARVTRLEAALAPAAAPPEGQVARRERLEQEAFRLAQSIEGLNGQAAAIARQIEAREQDLRESVRMRDPAREIEAQRGAIGALQADHASIMIDLDVAQRNLAAMVERAKAELGPHGPAPMAPKNAKAEADRQRAAVALRQAQVRLSSLRSEVEDPATGRDFARLNLVRREIRETEEEIATLEARVKQNPDYSVAFKWRPGPGRLYWIDVHDVSGPAEASRVARKRVAGLPKLREYGITKLGQVRKNARRNPVDDDALRRLEREAAQSPHDQALQDRLEHERTRRDPEGAHTVEQQRSAMLKDLEKFSLSLHSPGPSWRLLARLGGVLAEFAGLSVDSAQRRFSDFYSQFGREALFLSSTPRLMSEVGLGGVARAIADASRQQIRRYMAVRDAVLEQEVVDDERLAQTLASKKSLLPRPRQRRRGLNPIDDDLRRRERAARMGSADDAAAYLAALRRQDPVAAECCGHLDEINGAGRGWEGLVGQIQQRALAAFLRDVATGAIQTTAADFSTPGRVGGLRVGILGEKGGPWGRTIMVLANRGDVPTAGAWGAYAGQLLVHVEVGEVGDFAIEPGVMAQPNTPFVIPHGRSPAFFGGSFSVPVDLVLAWAAAHGAPAVRANPELPAPAPQQPRDSFLPALPAQVVPRNTWAPPRVTWDLMASGQQPLVYLPAGVSEHPPVRAALEQVMTRRGLASVDAWENLLAAVGARAKLFVVDRNGERWQVTDVRFHYGGESGELVLRHLGRLGERVVDIHQAYGRMIPVIVYKPHGYVGPS